MKPQNILAALSKIVSPAQAIFAQSLVKDQRQAARPSTVQAVIFTLLLLLFGSQSIYAQSETPKWEAGAQFTVLRHNGSAYSFLIDVNGSNGTDVGGGGRVTYNVTKYLSLEGEMNFFPRDFWSAESRTQGLFGVKIGKRFTKVGIFGKARPGFMRFSQDPSGGQFFLGKTVFALDLGEVIEIYHSRRFYSRFDVGSVIIRSAGWPDSRYTNNFQFSAGVGFRF